MKISQLLKIQKGITALIGGGGKTTLMYRLAQELSEVGTVIVSTSTKIIEPEGFEVITEESEEMITDKLNSQRIVCVGTRVAGGKLSASVIGFDRLKELADYVIVEADGAHRLPVKARTRSVSRSVRSVTGRSCLPRSPMSIFSRSSRPRS